MEKKFKVFIAVAVTAILIQGVITFVWLNTQPKTAYINTETVYNNFELKKKLEAQLKETQTVRQVLLDSLRFQIEVLSLELEREDRKNDPALMSQFNSMRESYYARQQEFDESNTLLAEKYTGEVWSQLNTYIAEYGAEEEFEYIFGASGDGSLMYADDAVNITDEVNEFVNERYLGK
jgi:outer membrane protein